jgi:hypothetical protein
VSGARCPSSALRSASRGSAENSVRRGQTSRAPQRVPRSRTLVHRSTYTGGRAPGRRRPHSHCRHTATVRARTRASTAGHRHGSTRRNRRPSPRIAGCAAQVGCRVAPMPTRLLRPPPMEPAAMIHQSRRPPTSSRARGSPRARHRRTGTAWAPGRPANSLHRRDGDDRDRPARLFLVFAESGIAQDLLGVLLVAL